MPPHVNADSPEESRPKVRDVIRITRPYLQAEMWRKRSTIAAIIITSLLLGVIPTLKSQLESGLLDQVDRFLRSDSHTSTSELMTQPVRRFAIDDGEKRDWIESVTHAVLTHRTVLQTILLYLLIGLCGYFTQWLVAAAKAGLETYVFGRLRGRAAHVALTRDSSELPALPNPAAHYSTAIHQGAKAVTGMYGYLLDGFQYAFSVITVFLFVGSKSLILVALFMTFVAAQAGLALLQSRRLTKRRLKLDESRNTLLAKTDEILTKREIILAWEQQARYEESLGKLTDDYAKLDRHIDVTSQRFRVISDALFDLGRVGVPIIAIATMVALDRKNEISGVGDMYFLLSLYVRLLIPAVNLTLQYDSIKRVQSTASTFLELLASKPKPPVSFEGSYVPPPAIHFDNVSFQYPNEYRKTLKACSFDVPARKTTLIMGPSGCGKTTVARLLLGFWRPTEGDIVIDGKAASNMTSAELRLLISYVSQADHILDETVAENLSWPRRERGVSRDAMVEALDQLGVKNAAERLEEAARQLSFGEQQRLSLARLLLDESPIFILDEPLSGLDVRRLATVTADLRDILRAKQRTTIIITHQTELAALADHVVLLTQFGEVAQQGATAELIQSGGEFSELLRLASAERAGRSQGATTRTAQPLVPRADATP